MGADRERVYDDNAEELTAEIMRLYAGREYFEIRTIALALVMECEAAHRRLAQYYDWLMRETAADRRTAPGGHSSPGPSAPPA